MSTFNTSILVTADTAQAVAALKGVGAELRTLGPASEEGSKTAVTNLAAFRRSADTAATGLKDGLKDVGQALGPGSPLVLAAQQADGLAVAAGPVGAGGAIRALGGLLLGMINPVGLAATAVTVGFGLITRAILNSFDSAKDFDEAIKDLGKTTKAFRDAAGRDLADLRREFGTLTPEIVELQRQITELALVDQLLAAGTAARALSDDLDGIFRSRGAAVADLFDLGTFDPTGGGRQAAPQAALIDRLLGDLPVADGAAAQLDIVRQIKTEILAATGGISAMNVEQREFFAKVIATERGLTAVKLAQDGIGTAQARAVEIGEKLLADLRAEADLKLLIRSFGEDSVQVAQFRAQAEKQAFEATLKTLDVSDSLKAEIMAAWRAARGLGSTNIGAGIDAAASSAAVLAREMNISLRAASALLALGRRDPVVLDPRDPRFNQTAATAARLRAEDGTRSPFDVDPTGDSGPTSIGSGAARRGRRGDEAARAALAAGRAELAILREADPLRREELRLRERLTDASDELIDQLARETVLIAGQKAAVENLKGAWRNFSDGASSALDGLIVQGNSLKSVLSDLLRSLASSVLSGVLNGGGLLGGTSGGLFGALGRGLGIPGLADGGLIAGPGGPRDDSILARLSAGEFIVNAAATARNRGLLEAINAAPRFAAGGMVGASAPGGGGLAGLGGTLVIDLRLSDDIDARIGATAEGVSARVSRDHIAAYDRLALPRRVAQISRDPRRIG